MSRTKTYFHLLSLVIVLSGLALYNFIGAQTWTAPTATPPANNAATPVNIGGGPQTKTGDFSVSTNLSGGNIWSGWVVQGPYLIGSTQMRANAYCDLGGGNCFAPWGIQQRVGGSCPTGQAIRAIAADGSVTCQAVGGPTGPTGPACTVKFYTKTGCGTAKCNPGDSTIGQEYDTGPDCSKNNKQRGINCATKCP